MSLYEKDSPNFKDGIIQEPLEPANFAEQAQPLIEPMIFYDKNSSGQCRGLKSPMEFFPGPIPSCEVDKYVQETIDLFAQKNVASEMSILSESKTENTISHNTSMSNTPFKNNNSVDLEKIDEDTTVDNKHRFHKYNSKRYDNPYELTQYFLSRVYVKVIKDKFYLYNGRSYEEVSKNDLARKVLEVCRNVASFSTNSTIDQIVNFVLKEPRICIKEEELPNDLIVFENGVLNIRTQQFFRHSPNYIVLHEIKCKYSNFNIHTPVFDAFLKKITGGDDFLQIRILQMLGYIITPDTNAKCIFVLQGVGNSGKSVLCNFIQRLFTDNAIMQLDITAFSGKFSTSTLVGKALCVSPDLPASYLDANVVSKLKQLSGNDPVSSDVKYGSYVKFKCNAKFLFATNHAIISKSADDAFYSRLCTISFKYSVPKEQQDFTLEEKLLAEKDGIVSKALAYYYELLQSKYIFCGNYKINETIQCVSSTKSIDDIVCDFCKNFFAPSPFEKVFTEDAWNIFCDIYQNIDQLVFSRLFGENVKRIYGIDKERKRRNSNSNAISCFPGLKIKTEQLKGDEK